jgi:hypothetical protein
MELHLNWNDPVACSIENRIEANFPNLVTDALKIRRHANLPVRVIGPIEEWRFANTSFHVAYVDFEPIREGKSLTSSDTNCRNGKATRGGGVNESQSDLCLQTLKIKTSLQLR